MTERKGRKKPQLGLAQGVGLMVRLDFFYPDTHGNSGASAFVGDLPHSSWAPPSVLCSFRVGRRGWSHKRASWSHLSPGLCSPKFMACGLAVCLGGELRSLS